jgi:peptidoglycan/xylan/chitin deacetylase (PgdA/CDA1 family)
MKQSLRAALGWIVPALLLSACGSALAGTSATAATAAGPSKTVVSMTFDDGDADNFAVAAILKQYGLHATWYIPSGLVGRPAYMTWEQLQALQNDGNEIGGHGLDHVNIGDLSAADLRHQVCDDRKNLTNHGFTPASFAYPFGGYSQAAKAMVRECGYSDARTIAGGPEGIAAPDAYALRAFPYIVMDTDFPKLQRYVTGTRQESGGWVILIFHHVCDSCDYYAVKPDILDRFIRWLAEQQSLARLSVMTVGEVVRQGVTP